GMKEAASIGIIGGADGPTAVFVTGNPAWLIAAAVVAVVVLLGGAVDLYLHHKNKSDQ
ncbi:MAG: sodium ion-translocating decarboxylase subunit beta, partial [Oscillospiraceae bacterium]|nr:sodium ion-translocating decarboxylase subunit beta [Oscillospiraceae bacterium]